VLGVRRVTSVNAAAGAELTCPSRTCMFAPAHDSEHGNPMPCHERKRAAKERLSQETTYADDSTFLKADAAAAGADTSSSRRRGDVAEHSQGARHTGHTSVHGSSGVALGRSDVMGSQLSEMSGCTPPMTPTFVGQALNFDDLVKILKSTLYIDFL